LGKKNRERGTWKRRCHERDEILKAGGKKETNARNLLRGEKDKGGEELKIKGCISVFQTGAEDLGGHRAKSSNKSFARGFGNITKQREKVAQNCPPGKFA